MLSGFRPQRGLMRHLLWLCPLLLLACATGSPPSVSLPAPEREVRLEPGDQIEIKFLYWPELSDKQTVRPDGKISLPQVKEVQAAGLSPGQLNQELIRLYQSKIKDPELVVIVRDLIGRRVYVGGEVKQPGPVPLKENMTVLEAILLAGGHIKTSASLHKVVVIRRVGDKCYWMTVNVNRMMKRPSASPPIYLAPYDIILVPRTTIDQLDQWVEQYLTLLIPDTALFYTHQLNPKTFVGIGRR